MSARFGPKFSSRRNRGISHGGGLGGCRPIDCRDENEAKDKPTWQLRRKKRPVSLQLGLKKQGIVPLNTMTPHSLVVHETRIRDQEDHSHHVIINQDETCHSEKDLPQLPLAIRRDVALGYSSVLDNSARSQTPQILQDNSTRPVELPGSILLPHKGFVQGNTSPISPLSLKSRHRDLEGPRSPTPSLDTCSTADSEMDIFKNLTSSPQRSGKPSTSSSAIFGRTKKPLRAMGADELMECLPGLNRSVLTQIWAPAMQDELKRIRGLLQVAAETRLQSQADLETFGQDVNSIATSARDISRNYFQLTQRVGAFEDRDAKAIYEQLEATEAELRIALAVVEDKKNTISDKEALIARLRETVAANTQIFGGFIQDHAGNLLSQVHDLRTAEIQELIRDQQQHLSEDGNGPQGGFVWIPEEQYNSYIERLRCTQQHVEQYSEVAKDQIELIRSQSSDLDKRLDRYAECMTVLDRRQAQILDLESCIDAKEKELTASKIADRGNAHARDSLRYGNQALRQHCNELDKTLELVRGSCQKQLESKDGEIFTLRQRLGETGLDTAYHRSRSMASSPLLTTSTSSSQFKKPLSGGEGEKYADQDQTVPLRARRALLRRRLPSSQSTLSLNTSETSAEQEKPRNIPILISDGSTRPPNHTFSITNKRSGRPSGQSSSGGTSSSRLMLSGLRLNPPASSTPLTASQVQVTRPRIDSLRTARPAPKTAVQNSGSIVNGSRSQSAQFLNRQKALPTPPVHPSQAVNVPSLDSRASNNETRNPNAAYDRPSAPTHTVSTNGVSDNCRARSGTITSTTTNGEKSQVDTASNYSRNSDHAPTDDSTTIDSESTSHSAPSASSSDQAAFQSSMDLLDQLATTHDHQGQQQQPDQHYHLPHLPETHSEEVERADQMYSSTAATAASTCHDRPAE